MNRYIAAAVVVTAVVGAALFATFVAHADDFHGKSCMTRSDTIYDFVGIASDIRITEGGAAQMLSNAIAAKVGKGRVMVASLVAFIGQKSTAVIGSDRNDCAVSSDTIPLTDYEAARDAIGLPPLSIRAHEPPASPGTPI